MATLQENVGLHIFRLDRDLYVVRATDFAGVELQKYGNTISSLFHSYLD